MKANVDYLCHLSVIMSVESLGSFHSHILVPDKCVHHLMVHVQCKVQMVLDCLMLITCCLYQHLSQVRYLATTNYISELDKKFPCFRRLAHHLDIVATIIYTGTTHSSVFSKDTSHCSNSVPLHICSYVLC